MAKNEIKKYVKLRAKAILEQIESFSEEELLLLHQTLTDLKDKVRGDRERGY